MKAILNQDVMPRRTGALRPAPWSSPAAVFAFASLCGLAILGLGAKALFDPQDALRTVGPAALAYLAAAGFCVVSIQRTYPHARLGLCNLATLARMGIVGILAVAMLAGQAPNAGVLALALVSLCLDGVDGWLARRQKLASDFGARFDVEVDAAFALLLSIYAATSGLTGAYVILLGLPHYLFWIARRLWPWLNTPLPPSFSRKAVCVLQIGTLIALLVPALTGMGRDGLVLAVVLALAWSFGRDILWLRRARA